MPSCCVPGCDNRLKGTSMRRFPRDAVRRALWAKQIPRTNWQPHDNSYICDVHFAAETWEKTREDGKRRLKWNAVPTIFSTSKILQNQLCVDETSCSVLLKSPSKRVSDVTTEFLHQNSCKKLCATEPSPSTSATILPVEICNDQTLINDAMVLISILEPIEDIAEVQAPKLSDASTPNSSNLVPMTLTSALLKIQKLEKEFSEVNEKLSKVNKRINKSEKIRRILITRNKKFKQCQKSSMDEKTLTSKKILQNVFNDDQIKWLQSDDKKRRLYKWSDETIKKALRIRLACTENGYKELINQNIPLPSTRTLRRSLQSINFTPEVCKDIFEALKDKVEQFTDDRDRDGVLGIDGISLVEGEKINPSTNSHIAFITIPNSNYENTCK